MPQPNFRSRIPGWLADLLTALGLLPLSPDTTPPTISLTASSTAFTAPGTLNLTPTVGGTVARVEFYLGTVKVGEAFSAPYAFPVTISSSAQAGNYSAKAIKLGVPAVASNALSVTVEIVPPPPIVATLTNDGDAFTWAYRPYTGAGTISSYRTYSLRGGAAISRVLLADTPTAVPVMDNTVQDGAVGWYKTYAVIGNSEVLIDSAMDTQPVRTGWEAGQLVINAPGNYTLKHRNTDRTRAAVVVNAGVTGVTIGGLLASAGHGISVGMGAEVNIQGVRGWGLHPGVADAAHGMMVTGQRAAKITVEHCYSENWLFSVYADGQNSGVPTSDLALFRVRYNRFRNCEGRKTTLAGYVQTGDSRWLEAPAHFIQLNGCQGILDAEIAWNELIQEPEFGYVEDLINIYNSSATSGNRGKIHHNLCYGGNAPNDLTTRGYAGVGIIFDGTSSLTRYWRAYSNTVTTTNGGVGVAHGYDIDVYDNDAYNAGVLEDGRKLWAVNVGIYAYNYVESDPIKRIKVYGNRSRYYRTPGTERNPTPTGNPNYGSYYLNVDGVDGNEMSYSANTDLPLEADPAKRIQTERGYYRAWLASAAAAGVTLGAA